MESRTKWESNAVVAKIGARVAAAVVVSDAILAVTVAVAVATVLAVVAPMTAAKDGEEKRRKRNNPTRNLRVRKEVSRENDPVEWDA